MDAITFFLLPTIFPGQRTTGVSPQTRAAGAFAPERFPIFGADISATGFYGFPLNRDGVSEDCESWTWTRDVARFAGACSDKEEENRMREFLADSFPSLADAPVVFTRVCFYCDTRTETFGSLPIQIGRD